MLEDLYECLELMKLTPQNIYNQMIKLRMIRYMKMSIF